MNEAQPLIEKHPLMIGRLQIDAWQQWSEWFGGNWNWKNFVVIEIGYEFEAYCEGHEFQFSLLGLCLRLTYWYSKDFWKNRAERSADSAESNGNEA